MEGSGFKGVGFRAYISYCVGFKGVGFRAYIGLRGLEVYCLGSWCFLNRSCVTEGEYPLLNRAKKPL